MSSAPSLSALGACLVDSAHSALILLISHASPAPCAPVRASRRIAAAIRRSAPALTAFALLCGVGAPVASAQSYSYSRF